MTKRRHVASVAPIDLYAARDHDAEHARVLPADSDWFRFGWWWLETYARFAIFEAM